MQRGVKYLRKITGAKQEPMLILLGLAFLIIGLRLPFLEQPFDNNSAANAYHARLIVQGDPLYSTHHPAHHLPALYYIYALTFWALGDEVWTIKFVLIPWTMVTVYLLYRLGALLFDRQVGLLAAFFYTLLTAQIGLFGATGQRELFANLPRIAALLVLMHLVLRAGPAWQFIFVGLLSAAAFLFKATYLSPLALAGFVLLVTWWADRTPVLSEAEGSATTWRVTMVRGVWVGAGFLLGILFVAGYFWLVGLLPRLLTVFSFGTNYIRVINSIPTIGEQTWLLYFLFPLIGLALNNAVLLMLSLGGCLLILVNRGLRNALPFSSLVVWYGLSFVEAGINRRFFTHYYLLIVPPLVLLAAWFILTLYHDLQRRHHQAARIIVAGVLGLALFISLQQNFNYYRHYFLYRLGRESYQEFLIEGWPEEGPKLVLLQRLADYIDQHTTATDRIYYWSFNVQPYYLAKRRAPIAVIWPDYASLYGGPDSPIFSPQTKYIIIDTSINITTPDWIYKGLAENYHLEATIEDQEIYRRIE